MLILDFLGALLHLTSACQNYFPVYGVFPFLADEAKVLTVTNVHHDSTT
jgi:hypothetical protein